MKPLVGAIGRASRHWLAAANLAVGLFVILPFVAPALVRLGRADLANVVYDAFQLTCHEWPSRSYFLFGPQLTYTAGELTGYGLPALASFRGSPEVGYKVALCGRNVAIYAGALLAGLAYSRARHGPRPLSFGLYLVLIAPLAIDGLTQLVGWRESTWELRTLTGLLFGVANVRLLYPRLDVALGTGTRGASVPARRARVAA